MINGFTVCFQWSCKEFATFDDPVSIKLKTQYAIQQQLIMFWQLTNDREDGALLNAIDEVRPRD